jgi:molybdate transport system substrate-binding protein
MQVCVAALWAAASPYVHAADALVAVATNFSEVARQLKADFEASGDHRITLAAGSTGKLYAQILNGAPYDVLLAADQERPRLLEASGPAVRGSRFVYATGRLALWSPTDGNLGEAGRTILTEGNFDRLAMANPELAPYGKAARETLRSLGVWQAVKDKIILGENIGQAHVMVATRNADLGFIALSQLRSTRIKPAGSHWDVPERLHSPILQDAILLHHGSGNAAARAFLQYLQDSPARETIESYGYAASDD